MNWPIPATRVPAEEDQWSCDLDRVREKLVADAGRLFSTEVDEVEIWKALYDGELAQRRMDISTGNNNNSLQRLWQVGSASD